MCRRGTIAVRGLARVRRSPPRAGDGIDRVDVATRWRRQRGRSRQGRTLGAVVAGYRRRRQTAATRRSARTARRPIVRHGTRPDRPAAERDDAHGKPPFGKAPARPLARARGQPEDVVGEVGHARCGGIGQPRGQVALEIVVAVHAITVLWSAGWRSSAAMAARSSARARFRRDWAVPSGMSRVSATADVDMPT